MHTKKAKSENVFQVRSKCNFHSSMIYKIVCKVIRDRFVHGIFIKTVNLNEQLRNDMKTSNTKVQKQ